MKAFFANHVGKMVLLLLLSVGCQRQVHAACTFNSGYSLQNMSITLPDVTVGRDVAVGTVLKSVEATTTTGLFAYCTSPGNAYYITNNASLASAGGQNVFATNVSGIGLRLYFRTVSTGTSYRFGPPGTVFGSYVGDWNWYLNGNSWWGAQIIVTGPVSSGVVDGSIYGTVTLDSLLVTRINISGFKVTALACTTPDVTVALGTHPQSEMSGLNTYTSSTSFNVSLNNCPAGMNTVQYRIDPVTSVLNSGQSVVALDNSSGTSSATGVGVQLLDGNGAVFPLSTYKTFASYDKTNGGSYAIPFKARYYQTAARVTPGAANTSMTFTMLYQ